MSAAGIALAVPDLAPEVREFAEQQVFNDAAESIDAGAAMPGLILEQVVKELHDAEINVGLQSFCWCGLRIWVGDPLNGIRAEASVSPSDLAWQSPSAVATWLHDAACRLYPESDYARRAAVCHEATA